MSWPPRAPRPGRATRLAPDRDFASLLDDALTRRGVTVTALRDQLARQGHAVSLTTLHYWRTGQRRPERPASLDAIVEIEQLLRLAPGTLIDALPPARRPGPRVPTVPVSRLAGLPHDGSDLGDFGFLESEKQLRPTFIHVALDVDKHRRDHRVVTRLGLRALVDDVATFPVGISGISPGEDVHLEWVHGGHPLGTAFSEDLGLRVWQLGLDRPLRTNEICVVEHALTLPAATHDWFEYYVEEPVREFMIWVRFTPPALPRTAEQYDDSSGREVVTPVDVAGVSTLTMLRSSFGPGRAGARWTW